VVQGGTFIMNGGTISGNAAVDGGGVSVKSGGTFTMNNGTISGNATNSGGGVWVKGGTFIMNGGIISGNSASGYGGGVYVDSSSTFIKSGTGGVIYGSNAPEGQANKARSDIGGHAVYSNYRIRNTTVWGATALDYTKKNASKDWQ
jgi:hypothetical protein